MCLLLETICISHGHPLNLDYHRRRMKNSSLSLFPGYHPPDLKELLSKLNPQSLKGTYRWRIVYGPDQLLTELLPYNYKPIRYLKLIEANIDYPHKFANRTSLDSLHNQRGQADDVLLVKDGRITDTTIANIIFIRGGRFYTPARPLLRGTALCRLLNEGKVTPLEISPDDIGQFEAFWLINALRVAFPFDPSPIEGIIK